MRKLWISGIAAFGVAVVAPAFGAPTPIALTPGQPYKNKPSGIVIAPVAGGLARSRAVMLDQQALDVALTFPGANGSEELTLYLFRRVTGDGAVWIDRIQHVIEDSDRLGTPTLVEPAHAFAVSGRSQGSGLKTVYALRNGPMSATGAAIAASPNWYVVVRASSSQRSAAQMSAWLDQAMASVSWPKTETPLASAPIAVCATRLPTLAEAKVAPADGSSTLLNAIIGMVPTKPAPAAAPATWCREPLKIKGGDVYRPNGDPERYLLAVGDSGRGLSVGPNTLNRVIKPDAPQIYSATLMLLDSNVGFADFASLPAPAQAAGLLANGTSAFRTPTWGPSKTVNINAEGFK